MQKYRAEGSGFCPALGASDPSFRLAFIHPLCVPGCVSPVRSPTLEPSVLGAIMYPSRFLAVVL